MSPPSLTACEPQAVSCGIRAFRSGVGVRLTLEDVDAHRVAKAEGRTDIVRLLDRQYTSIKFSERLAGVGVAASVGSVGDSYDNTLAETINGLYKTELIKKEGPWRTVEQVELATAEWVDWFNFRRLYEYCGGIPPAELENAYYAQNRVQQIAELSHH